MSKVVIINGFPQAGKDTFIELCQELRTGVYNIHTSTPAKKALKELGWDGIDKNAGVRNLLALMMEFSYKAWDGPTTYCVKSVLDIDAIDRNALIFIHCREPHNIDKLKHNLPFSTTLFICREDSIKDSANESDQNVENYKYDYAINNDGTLEELKELAQTFLYKIGGDK